MIFSDIHEFFPHIVKGKRIMGIDFGAKNVGLAFSDRNHVISNPHSVYKRRNMSKDLSYLGSLFREQDCTAIVMGMPREHHIKDQDWVDAVEHFTKKLSEKHAINIYLQDENLSTRDAVSILKSMSVRKIKGVDDKIAASCILGRTLDIIEKLC